MRLDKYISLAIDCSRKDAKGLIVKKKVKVLKDNTEITKITSDYNIINEKVYYNDLLLDVPEYIYIMMNKPAGVVSANSDSYHKCALDYINEYRNRDLGIVGRLDIDSEGLLLITDDGTLLHKLTHPKSNHEKKYYCLVSKPLKNEDIESFKNGVVIDVDGKLYKTKEANLEIIESNKCYVTITEGKFHQIKLMMKAIGNEVLYLKRIAINNLSLDNNLKPGEYRLLSNNEIEIIKK